MTRQSVGFKSLNQVIDSNAYKHYTFKCLIKYLNMDQINNTFNPNIILHPIVNLFAALGDYTRFKLVKILLSERNICVSELAERLGISVAGTSQQLKILETAGIVNKRRDCQKICYSLQTSDKLTRQIIKLINT
jgi:DNA-binding transcriptional ArsR family regulator